jgi:hypothetical protein
MKKAFCLLYVILIARIKPDMTTAFVRIRAFEVKPVLCAGLPDFFVTIYQKGRLYQFATKYIQNAHKISQMAVK